MGRLHWAFTCGAHCAPATALCLLLLKAAFAFGGDLQPIDPVYNFESRPEFLYLYCDGDNYIRIRIADGSISNYGCRSVEAAQKRWSILNSGAAPNKSESCRES